MARSTGVSHRKESIYKHQDSAGLMRDYKTTSKTFKAPLVYKGTNKRKHVIYFYCTICNTRTASYSILLVRNPAEKSDNRPVKWKFGAMSKTLAQLLNDYLRTREKFILFFCRQ